MNPDLRGSNQTALSTQPCWYDLYVLVWYQAAIGLDHFLDGWPEEGKALQQASTQRDHVGCE